MCVCVCVFVCTCVLAYLQYRCDLELCCYNETKLDGTTGTGSWMLPNGTGTINVLLSSSGESRYQICEAPAPAAPLAATTCTPTGNLFHLFSFWVSDLIFWILGIDISCHARVSTGENHVHPTTLHRRVSLIPSPSLSRFG